MKDAFNLLESTAIPEDLSARRARLLAEPPRPGNFTHKEGAPRYRASESLRIAINSALALEMPLLVAGEPGTGKTQAAWFLAAAFGLEDPLVFPVRSSTTAKDLLYDFDAVGDFRDAQPTAQPPPNDRGETRAPPSRARHVTPGPLWTALTADSVPVLLIDEVDKAPRDFPNDLLDVLDRFRFPVPELNRLEDDEVRQIFPTGLEKTSAGWFVAGDRKRRRPIVVITTNSERRLPEPFLRRCIFHRIVFDEKLIEEIVAARQVEDFPKIHDDVRRRAIEVFIQVRDAGLRKMPSTAELLAWLRVLYAREVEATALEGPLAELPHLEILVKSQDDLDELDRQREPA